MNGIETLDKIKAYDSDIPVVMLSSGQNWSAISCMHHKAFDYVKSETAFLRLQKKYYSLFPFERIEKRIKWYMARM
jgi:DNA-binding NtrC family response regulator